MRALLLAFVRAYRAVVSPMLPAACRFVPSCSAYAEEAILLHGAIAGSAIAFRRLLRCHPWGGSGYDPVVRPRRTTERDTQAHNPMTDCSGSPHCTHAAACRADVEP